MSSTGEANNLGHMTDTSSEVPSVDAYSKVAIDVETIDDESPKSIVGVVKPMEGSRKPRPQKDHPVNCPTCNSSNIKFGRLNYNGLSQAIYICKACKKYWTDGESLRNVPVGGGSRENKRSSSSTPTTFLNSPLSTPTIFLPQLSASPNPNPNTYSTNTTATTTSLHHLHHQHQLLPMSVADTNNGTIYSSSGFGLQEFKPNLDFSLDVFGSLKGFGGEVQSVQDSTTSTSARLFSPFEELKQEAPNTDEFEQNRSGQGGDQSNGY